MKMISSEKIRIQAFLVGLFSATLYLCIGLSSLLTNTLSNADPTRFGLAIALSLYSVTFYVATSKRKLVPEIVIAMSSFIFLITVPLFALAFLLSDANLAERVSVSLVLGLLLHYGVLRLSSKSGLIIGLLVTGLSLLVINSGHSGGLVRAGIFLIAANMAGFYISRGFHKRDFSEGQAREQIKKEWLRQRSARRAFDEALAENRRWFGTISHELNQPLAIASIEVKNMLQDFFNEKPNFYTLVSSAKKVQCNLSEISDVLDAIIGKAENSNDLVRLRLGWIKLMDAVLGAIEQIGVNRVEFPELLSQEIFPIDEVYVYSDPLLLKRVIRNFLENSIKYSSANGRGINLLLRRKGDRLSLVITNKMGVVSYSNFGKEDYDKIGLIRLGLGLGVGSRFTRLMNDSLPGHAIQFRQFGSKLAVSRVSFGPNFFSCRSSNIRSSGAIKVSVFSENNSLVGFVSREAAKNDVPINIYPISDLSEQLQIEIAAGASSLDSLFLVEICQGYLGARDFFGDDLYISMTDFGRFVFISDSDLDSTYQELGVIARFPVGVEGIFNRFAL